LLIVCLIKKQDKWDRSIFDRFYCFQLALKLYMARDHFMSCEKVADSCPKQSFPLKYFLLKFVGIYLLPMCATCPTHNILLNLNRKPNRINKHLTCLSVCWNTHFKCVIISCRCGALHVGDQILAVDDTRVDGLTMTAVEVMQLLRNTSSAQITVEILPLSQLNCGWRLSEDSVCSRGRATLS
jgi:hypothetical protein